MAGSVAVRAKRELIAQLKAHPDLAGIQVAYSFPGATLEQECIYGGRIFGPVKLLTMRGQRAAARREDLVLLLHTEVFTPGESDTAAAEERAAELGAVVEELVAANPTLGEVVDGLGLIQVTDVRLESQVDDDGAAALLTHQLTIVGLIR